jgi:NAD(P) transhydrogenase subunit beta
MSDLAYYASCGILAAGVLAGIAMMSKVESSVKGNLLSAVCTAAAIILTLYRYDILYDYELWICMFISVAAGLIGAYKVKMIEMPETVALFNGFGGAASALVAAISLLDNRSIDLFSLLTAGLALSIGTITLTGSIVAGGKLHKVLPQRPILWEKHQLITTVVLLFAVVSIIAMAFVPQRSTALFALIVACAMISGFFGVAFAIRVGGADMPITISLLNSFSGVAGSIAGMAVSDLLLVSVGGIVGASGLLLTQIMCRSMNRSLADIMLGKTSMSDMAVSAKELDNSGAEVHAEEETDMESKEEEDPAWILSKAKKAIIVPGYGMALAQAQGLVKQLTDKLEANGTEVLFAIHPVAGRMPGHMNVLLCEVDIPYEKLHEMDEINPQFSDCDVALIIGANDVINPAANTATGTPIYGMPILEVSKAKHIIICNYNLEPGYSGVENPLYRKTQGVTLLLGDAKETLAELLNKL